MITKYDLGLRLKLTATKLRIIETTDLHMQLSGYDYLRDQPVPARGLAHLAPKIDAIRNEGIASLLFDNGDFLQGTALADTAMANLDDGSVHPMIAAMNTLNYDAITLGNHEFDYGLDKLRSALSACNMPVVSANVRTSLTDYLVAPWTIIKRQMICDDGRMLPLNVGVIGFVTPQINEWNYHVLQDVIATDDIVNAAKTHLGAMRRAGADIIVGLCHAGLAAVVHSPRMENAAAPLAALLGIDVVLAGHTHNFFPSEMFPPSTVVNTDAGQVYGKPMVMAGYDGLALGVIDLDLNFSDDRWSITKNESRILHAADIDAEPTHPLSQKILEPIAAPHLATRKLMSTVATTTENPISSHFTMVGADQTLHLVAHSQIQHMRKLLDDPGFESLPLIGSASSFRSGGHGGPSNFIHVPPGPIVNRDIGAMTPFNNPICAVLRRGWQVKRWLEYSAGYFQQIYPGMGAQPLICPHIPSYHFDWLIGLNYAFDLTSPARFDEDGNIRHQDATRVVDLSFEGKPVLDDDLFIVVTSVYRAHGGGGQGPIEPQDVLRTSATGATDILADSLSNRSSVIGHERHVWDFAPIDGARGVFRTSPNAQHGPLPDRVKRLAESPDGFDAYAITF